MLIATVIRMLESPYILQQAIEHGSGEDVYLALWIAAGRDAYAAVALATEILADADAERRFAALYLLGQLRLPEALQAIVPALADEDIRIISHACSIFHRQKLPRLPDMFERVEHAVHRLPGRPRQLEPFAWLGLPLSADKAVAAGLLVSCLDEHSPTRLIPYLSNFAPYDRIRAAGKFAAHDTQDAEAHDALLKLVSDRSRQVRKDVIDIVAEQPLSEHDAVYLEGLLTRKTGDLRRGVLRLLALQANEGFLASANRLVASSDPLQRVAGLELLRMLVEDGRETANSRQAAETYRQTHDDMDRVERTLIRRILSKEKPLVSLDNCLGLVDMATRTPTIPPQKRDVTVTTSAALNCLTALDGLVHENRQMPIIEKKNVNQEVLLGNGLFAFLYKYDPNRSSDKNLQHLPLHEVWQDWYTTRPDSMRDDDGLELIRAFFFRTKSYHHQSINNSEPVRLRYGAIVEELCAWLMWLYPAPGGADFVLDVLENDYASLSRSQVKKLVYDDEQSMQDLRNRSILHSVRKCRYVLDDWGAEHDVRLYQLLHWIDQPLPNASRHRPELEKLLRAYEAGAANDTDLYDQLLGPRPSHYYGSNFSELQQLSSKEPHALLTEYPQLATVFEACRDRILEIEVERGEMPTAASSAAMALRSVYGTDWYVRIVSAIGDDELTRGYMFDIQNRSTVLSHLLLVSLPRESETAEEFTDRVRQAGLTQEQLIQSAAYAPQWAVFTESALEWPGFADAVWWLHAHTKDSNWYVDSEIREEWQAQVSERTPLSSEDLLAGAIDVTFFWQTYSRLGAERWSSVYEKAKYSAGGTGYDRAKLFAEAMLGQADREDIIRRLMKKRHQDSVRALGLLPLPEADRDAEILARYQVIQEFLRGSRKFGPQRRENEQIAARIAIENMARNAGYTDPLRLQWAMEAAEVADLRDGPVSVSVDNVTVSLSINDAGAAHIDVFKSGKPLKNVPARLRREPAVVSLLDRRKTIEHQRSRMRSALETAMCRAEPFPADELQTLALHPVMAPLMNRLVFTSGDITGYPVNGATALQHHDGTLHPVAADAMLRIAHTHDLYQSDQWTEWQRECFSISRVQPFKQVFRELYPVTEAEIVDGSISRRYAGQQIHPRQAMGLFGSRGWTGRAEDGMSRTFHKENLTVSVTFGFGFYAAAGTEGLTIEGVTFVAPVVGWRAVPLAEVPPILFSEVMRDLDLVVSVAHSGGVDPEATASTVEMRAALIRETLDLMRLNNVELRGRYALIEGTLGSYSVHLSSATVHRQPGGALCIIPVHAQHRGRLFLPFADDDPKTAEIISKVLLLAKDSQIKDPVILSQIYAGG